MAGKHRRACIIYNLSAIIVRLIGRDSHRRAHECVPAAAPTCYLQLVCVLPEKTINLELSKWNLGAGTGRPMHTEQPVPAVAH